MQVFNVLDAVYTLGRAGGAVTAIVVSKWTGLSVYRSRKLLHSLHALGLVEWTVADHRPEVLKRLYTLTRRGSWVHLAYVGNLAAIWEDS